ncbi:MAG: succinate dehydrogenase cytochrome b subunit [Bacteroidales bacterium]|nr:succinate dehydrogenase cytochrome b subunit [Bacteroidales bacterium]
MSHFFTSPVGKKFIMSITGIFLMLFLIVHLSVNSLLMVGSDAFNSAAHFMVTNPFIRILEPILALGFIIHIIYSAYLTLQNQRYRPVRYKKVDRWGSTTWPSRNMFILGVLILIFLVIHLSNFYWKVRFGHLDTVMVEGTEMENLYGLVSGLFINWWWYDVIYILGALFLGLHLSHGFWAAFQSLGWDNDLWRIRLKRIAYVFAVIMGVGFASIPVYFLITSG